LVVSKIARASAWALLTFKKLHNDHLLLSQLGRQISVKARNQRYHVLRVTRYSALLE